MSLARPHKKLALQALCRAALVTASSMPPAERADIYEGIAIACQRVDRDMADTAQATCEALREAEMMQLNFERLLNTEEKGARS